MSNQPEKGVDLAHPPLSPPPFFLHLSQNQQYRCSTEFIPRFRRRLQPAFPSPPPQVQKFFGQQSSDSKLKISIFFFFFFFNAAITYFVLFVLIYLFNLLIFFSFYFILCHTFIFISLYYNVHLYKYIYFWILIYLYFLLYSILIERC